MKAWDYTEPKNSAGSAGVRKEGEGLETKMSNLEKQSKTAEEIANRLFNFDPNEDLTLKEMFELRHERWIRLEDHQKEIERLMKPKCPIKGVSKDCQDCKSAFKGCVYVEVWRQREKGGFGKSEPYRSKEGLKQK